MAFHAPLSNWAICNRVCVLAMGFDLTASPRGVLGYRYSFAAVGKFQMRRRSRLGQREYRAVVRAHHQAVGEQVL